MLNGDHEDGWVDYEDGLVIDGEDWWVVDGLEFHLAILV